MAESDERQKFEAWAMDRKRNGMHGWSLEREGDDGYQQGVVHALWNGWKARSEQPADSFLISKDGIEAAAYGASLELFPPTNYCTDTSVRVRASAKIAAIILSKCQAPVKGR